MSNLTIHVHIYNHQEYEELKNYYNDHPNLKIHYGNIFNFKADALVTAGNSFGMMDGGIDGAVAYFFEDIENQVQQKIMSEWYGELPIGVSLLFPTPSNTHFQYLCYSPTMRVPKEVQNTTNAYLAMRGALVECSKQPNIKNIAVPLLCRGVGNMDPKEILRQIKHAYNTFTYPTERDWKHISLDNAFLENHWALKYTTPTK